MCQYDLPDAILLDNGTQFSSIVVTEFCKDLGVQTKFVSVIHPQANEKVESANKVILKGQEEAGRSQGALVQVLTWDHVVISHYSSFDY